MKHLQIFFLTCFLLVVNAPNLLAQSSTLRGQIVNAQNGETLVGVNIYLASTETDFSGGTASDTEGNFTFPKLPAGNYLIRISAVGFQPRERQILLQSNETRVLNVKMQPSTFELSEIVVSSTERTEISPTTIQRIPAEDIAIQDLSTVADVARSLPAAHVATNSRGQTILYLRNSADRQTAQFFNGALINVPWDNRVDISFLPASMLGGVTVSKGVPSVVYGTNTIGGAVNFQARSLASQGNLTEITLTGTSPGVGGASVMQMGNNGNFSYTAEAAYFKRNDYTLPDGATVPFSQPSDETRVNTDQQHFNLFLEGTRQFDSGARLSATVFHVDAEKGVAPESNINPAETSVRYWRYPTIRQSMVILNGMLPIDSNTHIRGSAWFNRYSQDINQYQSVEYENLDQTQSDIDLTGGLRLILEQGIGSGELDIALNALTTQHDQTIAPYSMGTAGADSSDTYGQHIYSVGAEYTVPMSEKLTGVLGVSYDGSAITNTGPWENEGFDNYISEALSLSAGITYQLSDRLLFRTALGRKPRFPTMRELYAGALGKFVPNPNLKPVTAYLGEAGMEWRGTMLSGSLTGFFTRTYDTIDKTTIQEGPNAGKERRINLDGSRVWGIEAVAAAQPFQSLSIDGSLTYMYIRGFFEDKPRKVDEKPAWLGKLDFTYDVTERFSALLQTEYTGGIYTRTEQNTFVLLPDALIFDTRLSYKLFGTADEMSGGELFFRINNITNDLRILQLGLPGPGREFMAGLKFRF